MSVNPILSSINLQESYCYHTQATPNIQQPTFKEVLERGRTNSITLEDDVVKVVRLNRGTINNNPDSEGGSSWTGSPGHSSTEEGLVALAIKAYTQQFNRKQEEEVDWITKKKRDADNEKDNLSITMKDNESDDKYWTELANELEKLNYDPTTAKYIRTDKENVLKEIEELSKYDVRNASFDEICKIANGLMKAGLISVHEAGYLTFDRDRERLELQRALSMPIPSQWLTMDNANGKRDWIAEWEAIMKRDEELGLSLNFESNRNIVDALRKIQKDKGEGVEMG